MICPICHKREATERLTKKFGASELSGDVCPDCVQKALSLDGDGFYSIVCRPHTESCSHCGRTLDEIMSTMIVGCPYCYTEFSAELSPLIDSVQKRG